MPRYFFDTDDGSTSRVDDVGVDLPDDETARREAQDALPDMACDKIPNGERRIFSVSVRDSAGCIIYTVDLTLNGRWVRK